MIARQSAPQTVQIHQASPGFAAPREAANFLRRAKGDGAKRIGERKMPSAATDVKYGLPRPGANMKLWTAKNRMQGFETKAKERPHDDATHSI
jgi:hypothetical protein